MEGTSMDIQEVLKTKIEVVEKALDKYMPNEGSYEKVIYESMRYSVFAGGKRLRPILMLAACEFVGGNYEDAIPYACAMEMIHSYSLIHDDLPAMDNDDYRRGKLTNHKIYGEAMAILAGDGLLNYAYELIIKATLGDFNKNKLLAAQEIAWASGSSGMIGGQVVDLLGEDKEIDKSTLDFIHKKKTGALIRGSIRAGAIIGGASENQLEDLTKYAENIGLGFQITDDILDIIGDEKKLGKKVGSDIENNKSTYPSLYGMEESIKKVNLLFDESINLLKKYEDKAEFFIELAKYLVKREY
jgi:geranylgeranyl diphosphate synthase type II